MEKLKQAIETQGRCISDDILKVDSFLNHQIDCQLMYEIGEEFYNHFKDKGITKVVTIETSGIAPSFACALKMNVPLIFIKKTKPSTMTDPVFVDAYSFTKQQTYTVCLEKNFVNENDKILFIDDFLANGEAFKACEQLISQTGGSIEGVGIVIEKRFQKGHDYIVNKGYDLLTLASIAEIKDKKITWAE